MKKPICLGIWMDHSSAHLTEFSTTSETTTVESEFDHQEKKLLLEKGESIMHNAEQHEQASFYKKLGEVIRNYSEVLLFGPTDAKSELFNILKDDHLFENIKIEVKQADKMTENQEHAFVKEHFTPHKLPTNSN
jgi:hypothetical protein